MTEPLHPAAIHHLPSFVTAPGETDVLFIVTAFFVLFAVVGIVMQLLYPGQLDDLPRGGSCIANAYTNNHDALQDPNLGSLHEFGLHAIDAVGIAHAMTLRIQALLLPIKVLVFSEH
jgi:hypothetical protein